MIYLLLGDQMDKKDAFIEGIKAKSPAIESASFDIENLDGSQVSKDDLKKALIALPMAASKRLVIVSTVHKLKVPDIQSLATFVSSPQTHVDVILESSMFELPSAFKVIQANSKLTMFGTPPAKPFEITNFMERRQTTQALLSLNKFLDDGMYHGNLLGVLVWYWGKHGRNYGTMNFEKGLKLLQEADLNIKRSRFAPAFTLEKVVTELIALQQVR